MTEAAMSPLSASNCIGSHDCKPQLDVSHVQQAMKNALSGQPGFPAILDSIALALSGNASLIAKAAGDPIPGIETVWSRVHTCNDQSLGENTFKAFMASFTDGEKRNADTIGRTDLWDDMVTSSPQGRAVLIGYSCGALAGLPNPLATSRCQPTTFPCCSSRRISPQGISSPKVARVLTNFVQYTDRMGTRSLEVPSSSCFSR